MFRRLILSLAVAGVTAGLAAGGALAQAACDINAEQAAVVAAWGAKLRDGSISGADSEAISAKIQQLPTLAQQDPAAACQALAELKVQLGLVPAQ